MRTVRFPFGAFIVVASLGSTEFALAEDEQSEQPLPLEYFVEGGASLFNSNTGFIRAKAGNVGVGYRFGNWSIGAVTGVNYWRSPLFGTDEQEHVGVFNLGAYSQWRFAKERARSAVGVGWSRVVEPTAVDAKAGSNGFYIDARPIGLRLPLEDGWAVGFDPLSIAFRLPDTTGVPLVEVQFMTWLRLEVAP